MLSTPRKTVTLHLHMQRQGTVISQLFTQGWRNSTCLTVSMRYLRDFEGKGWDFRDLRAHLTAGSAGGTLQGDRLMRDIRNPETSRSMRTSVSGTPCPIPKTSPGLHRTPMRDCEELWEYCQNCSKMTRFEGITEHSGEIVFTLSSRIFDSWRRGSFNAGGATS